MKRLLSILALIFISNVLFAQLPFSIGPKVGVNFSKISQDFVKDVDKYTEKSITGFQGGVFLRIDIRKFYLQPELYYCYKGGILKKNEDKLYMGDPSLNEIKISSLDLPILIGFKFIDKGVVNLRIFAGPVFSFSIDKKIDVTVDGVKFDEPILTEDDLKGGNWGLCFGVGADLTKLTMDIRYEVGVNDISSSSLVMKHMNVFTITLGLKLL